MGLNRGVFVLVVLVAALVGKAAAATYVVGDNLGWSVPSTANEYSTWASRHVFRSGDVLVFNFLSGQHDVAEVTKSAFDGCSSTNPITLSTVGPWNATLNTTGENFFICTFGAHCSLGQKLAINVTASPSTSPAPSPPMLPTPTPTPMPMPMPGSPPPMPMPGSPSPMPMPGSPSPMSMPRSPSPMPMPGSPSPMSMPGSPGSAPAMTPAGYPLPGTPGGAPSTPGALSPPSPAPPGNSATLSSISATLVVLASLAFGLTM